MKIYIQYGSVEHEEAVSWTIVLPQVSIYRVTSNFVNRTTNLYFGRSQFECVR